MLPARRLQLDFPPWAVYWLPSIILVVALSKIFSLYRRSRLLPPGPRGLPLLGNILQVPAQLAWLKFAEWSQEFGPIFSISMAGKPVIILNTFKVASDLLDHRSNIYSSRPRLVMAGEILTDGMSPSLTPYGPRWRAMRRVLHDGFGGRAIQKYEFVQSREAAFATKQILKTPNDFAQHLRRATAGSILSVVYGFPPNDNKDERILARMNAHVTRQTETVPPGAYLVDTFPILKYAPTWMARWKREGLEWHEQETKLFTKLIQEAKEKVAPGQAPTTFAHELSEMREQHGLTEKEAAWLAGTVLAAGGDTTFGTLLCFVQAMVLYPDALRNAQTELDKVVGRERVPTFEDQKSLQYIDALVKEVLRWRPIAPAGVPRIASEDDWYEGYLIPKGAMIIANIWAMNRDPSVFPDFDDFRPERFLHGVPEDTPSMGHVSFGFGRRICAGYNFANQMLFITIATMLWALDIDKATDEDGKPIVPSKLDFVDAGLFVIPAPFKCKISARFPEALAVLEREQP